MDTEAGADQLTSSCFGFRRSGAALVFGEQIQLAAGSVSVGRLRQFEQEKWF